MERETDAAHPAVLFDSIEEGEHAQAFRVLPRLCIQPVKQVDVEIVRLEPLELLVEEPVEILPLLNEEYGQLCGDDDAVAVGFQIFPRTTSLFPP